jgi:hypothetical protein
MKNKTKVISIILFFSAVIMVISLGGQKAEWKGTVENKNGVRVIQNPKEPLYGEIKLELEEDLSIGRDDDKNYLFYEVRGIALDSQQNIYVIDWGHFRIQKFDKDGNYLQTIGRHGQGPGEFQGTMQLRIDDLSGDIYIRDGLYEIEKFDKNGNYIEKIKLAKAIDDFDFDGKGNFFAIQRTVSEEDLSKTLCTIDTKGEIIKNYIKLPWLIPYQKKGKFESANYDPEAYCLFMSKLNKEAFVYGYSKDYELNIIDMDGRVLYKIRKDESPKGFSAKERMIYKKYNFNMPPHKPYFYSIITDSKGRIYVQKNRTVGKEFRVNREVDIFSKDGYYLYKSTIPRGTYIIKDGYLYAYVMNETSGEELVKRFRIENWSSFKETS